MGTRLYSMENKLNFLFQILENYQTPYNALRNLQTFSASLMFSNPNGCVMWISSSISPYRKRCTNIKLGDIHILCSYHGKHYFYWIKFHNWAKCLLEIHPFLLGEPLSHQPSFVMIHTFVNCKFQFVHPLVLYCFPSFWQLLILPSSIFRQRIKLLLHGLYPMFFI